ncbi:lactate utilization protein C [Rhodovarius crocodyli]|uniref:Lactate utilization protein C n=1 Tax=Rhodovarius crocodyli TaxID=1979269 RepID=A0A437MNK2_9PROT|nr:lactate utilization protein [Rhodovarius crocodyli]RVT99223.1 lactate utilization protein C [Rhodovarius crocodyli]
MSRDTILNSIRRGLKRGPLPADQKAMLDSRLMAHPTHIIPARSRLPRPQQVALFIANLEKEFATAARVPDADSVPAAVADYLAAQNLPARFAMAPHPMLAAMPWDRFPMLSFEARRGQGSDQASLQHGFAGIAETGTLMLPSAPERPTSLNLLPDAAMVVLRASDIVGAYEEAWAKLRATNQDALTGGFMPRNVMLVTGPSRSADIEQTLELGAHGPRNLHVIIVDDDPAAIPDALA